MDPKTASFEPHRRFLRALAYRMLGSVSEAEDVVQDSWLRWREADMDAVREPRAFLAQVATRLSLDRLKSAQRRREQYIGVWLPEPLVEQAGHDAAAPGADAAVELAQDVGLAFMLMLERLSAAERAVFLLHEVFDWDFDAIAQALGRSNAACRQLAARARAQIKLQQPRAAQNTAADAGREQALAFAFAQALGSGDIATLARTLADDVVYMSDGGGRVSAVPRPVQGATKVAKMLLGFARLRERDGGGAVVPARINGHMGSLLFDSHGHVVQTVALEFGTDGRVATIYVMRNPEKLRHLGPQPPRNL